MAATVIPALISFIELTVIWRATHRPGDVLTDVSALDSVLSMSALV